MEIELTIIYLIQCPCEDSSSTNRTMFVNLRSYKELLSQAHKPMRRWSTSWYVKKMIPSVHIPYCYAYSHALVTANHQSLLILIHLSLCVCISMSELRLKTSTTYKEWYIGIVNLCMQGVCFVNLGTCMVCVTHGKQICERDKSSWRILYFLLSSNTWEVRDGSELALMQLFYMQILTCKCKLWQWGHATSGLVGLGTNWEAKDFFILFYFFKESFNFQLKISGY